MIATTLPENLLAVATLIGAVGALVTSLENRKRGAETVAKVENVKDVVNGQTERERARTRQLAKALQDAGIPIPDAEGDK